MPKVKFGVGNDVKTDSGFAPYEGELPKRDKIYAVKQLSAAMKLTGEKSKNPGTEYINSLWQITEEGPCKGFTVYHRIVPGESEFQQIRIAQYMQAVCGKNAADVVHAKIEDGGKISKIGGKNPVGVVCGMSFQIKQDDRGQEGDMVAEANDLFPGWTPKNRSSSTLKSDAIEDAEEIEEIEDDELDEEVEEDDDAEEVDEEADDAEESDEDENDEEEDGPVEYSVASAMSLAELKALAKESEYKDAELVKFKGPKGKKGLLAMLVEDEVVESEESTDIGFSDEPPF